MVMNQAYQVYDHNHLRVVAFKLANKYENMKKSHVYWVAKELGIYPDGLSVKNKKQVSENCCGKINRESKYVTKGKMNEEGVKAIESYITAEGYDVKKDWKEEEEMSNTTNIWEQADLISMMKQDYEKAVKEKEEAKTEAEQYCALVDKYEKELEELKDKLLIAEKENNDLKSEKKELSKMQIDVPNFTKEIDNLQQRLGKYNTDINVYSAEVNELRKDVAALQTSINRLQENKKKLEAVISDLIGCSKRLMNLK